MEIIAPWFCARVVEATGEWPTVVPVSVVQVAPYGVRGLVFGCGRP